MAGKVYLVGAGPGDPELLTLKGLRALREAHVVVYDRLANPALLEHAAASAERVYVGKEAHRHAMPQEEINALLVQRAAAGQVVCRLKGGDPFVFGRGGEEAEALAAAGIAWEYVPGVTSVTAAPGYAGVPLTHRGLGSTVAIVTASQEDPGRPAAERAWEAPAAASGTAVFLMGVERLPEIAARLVAAGRDAETPAVVVSWGTYSRQQTVEGTLADIAGRCREAGLTAPAVTLVGPVAALRERLRWFDNRPLFGRRILVTRPRDQSAELARLIEAEGGEPVVCPVIRIRPIPSPDLSGLDAPYDWIVFTSINGVYSLSAALRDAGADIRRLGAAQIAAIGPETARAAGAAGLRVDFVPTRYVAEQLAAEFPEPAAGKRIMIPRAREARDLLPRLWSEQGASVDVVPVYETVPDERGAARAREAINAGEVDAITFTASSTVRSFAAQAKGVSLAGVTVACIGPITAQTALEAGFPADAVAESHTVRGLVEALKERFARKAGSQSA